MNINLKHYLVFTDKRIEVLEPIGFDGFNSSLVQEKGRFGRDVFFGAKEVSLTFSNEYGKKVTPTRTLDNGIILGHLTSGFELLLEEFRTNGNESIIYYELEENSVVINVGQLFKEKTDGLTYVDCKVTKVNEESNYETDNDTSIDLFGTTSLRGETITPVQTQKLFLKAKPVIQLSQWKSSLQSSYFVNTGIASFSPFQGVVKYGIDDTLSFFDPIVTISEQRQLSLIRAQNDLANVKIEISISYKFTSLVGIFSKDLIIRSGFDDNVSNEIVFPKNLVQGVTYNDVHSVTLPNVVQAGERIWIYFNTVFLDNITVYNYDVKITATSTAISSTIEAIRYIDAIKQVYKNIGSFPVNASRFDVGGQFYDQFITNGNLIRQITDEPFIVKLKDLNEQLKEVAGDYQVNKSTVYNGIYEDFYPNIEIGAFVETPDKDFFINDNDAYLIKNFDYAYTTFEEDRDEDNTLDAIHTDTEWYVPALNSTNKKDIKIPFFRDPYKFESIRRRANEKTTTAESFDDKIGIIDVIRIAPNTKEKLTRTLTFSAIVGGPLKFLSDGSFNWLLLGFQVGNTIRVFNGRVYTNYVVTAITDTILTVPYSGSASEVVSALFEIEYPLTNVIYTNRTNQGLISASNLLNPDNFSNLRYSIKRNLKYWEKFLNTCSKFLTNKSLENKYFKANGDCTTRFDGEDADVIENADILFTNDRLVTQNLINTTVTAGLASVKTLLENIQNINTDGSIGGFIRVQRLDGSIVKGYVSDLEHNWRSNELSLVLEEKEENEFLVVTYNGNILTINDVSYEISIRYNIFNDKIQFIDKNNINLCNRTIFSKVSYNGVVYNSADELAIAIGN